MVLINEFRVCLLTEQIPSCRSRGIKSRSNIEDLEPHLSGAIECIGSSRGFGHVSWNKMRESSFPFEMPAEQLTWRADRHDKLVHRP